MELRVRPCKASELPCWVHRTSTNTSSNTQQQNEQEQEPAAVIGKAEAASKAVESGRAWFRLLSLINLNDFTVFRHRQQHVQFTSIMMGCIHHM